MYVGTWENQYGSTVTITDEADQRIRGTFRTALKDSAFAGEDFEISGIHLGDCVTFAFSRSAPSGDVLCTFTGLMREGRMETVWHVVSDSAMKPPSPGADPEVMKLPWPHAVLTNADTWKRVA